MLNETLLHAELSRRKARGEYPITISGINALLKPLGYTLDRSRDHMSFARWMSGDAKGKSYPCISTGIKDVKSGLSFAHVECKNPNSPALQKLRYKGVYAIVKGCIFEI